MTLGIFLIEIINKNVFIIINLCVKTIDGIVMLQFYNKSIIFFLNM